MVEPHTKNSYWFGPNFSRKQVNTHLIAHEQLKKSHLMLTLSLPALGRISSLIVYHVTTPGRNRVKHQMFLINLEVGTGLWAPTLAVPSYFTVKPHSYIMASDSVQSSIYNLKFVHFKKPVAQISFLSKLWYFQCKSKQKVPQFWKKQDSRNWLLKMKGL